MYDRLCKRFPQYTEASYARDDADNNTYDDSFDATLCDDNRLLLIPMRHGWYDLIDFTYPITLARMAICYGCLDLLKHLDDKYGTLQVWMAKHDPASEYWHIAVDAAAGNGHLDVAQYLFSLGVTCTTDAMDWAAHSDHLHVVKWLHANRTEGCTTAAMDWAAGRSHLHVVQWLHANRKEGCTANAMVFAAESGHLHVIKWLHENTMAGCTVDAMDSAAERGHLHVVKWLHENRTEGCTTYAMDSAAERGHLHVVKWLHESSRQVCTPAALDVAINRAQTDVIKYMHSKGCRTSSKVVERWAAGSKAELLQCLLDGGYAVELDALDYAKTAEIADILLGSLTLDRAQTLLAQTKQGNATNPTTFKRLESRIKKLQALNKS